jgi:hypothetical protein
MGGLVVESALEQLKKFNNNNAAKIVQRLALVLTLGSPRHHLPSFLTSFSSRSSRRTISTSSITNSSSHIDFLPPLPTVHILAGPGDLMIPGLSSWASLWYNNNEVKKSGTTSDSDAATTTERKTLAATRNAVPLMVQVDMDDVPGVWCTASHKGMISCNQLVRQTVPLLVDAAARRVKAMGEEGAGGAAAAAAAGKAAAAAVTGNAAALKLTTSLLQGMPQTASETIAFLHEIKDVINTEEEKLSIVASSTTSRCRHSKESEFIFTQQPHSDKQQQNLCYVWNADEEHYNNTINHGSLFFLFSGMVPGTEFRVLVEFSNLLEDMREVDVSSLARPLPGMLEEYRSARESPAK